MSDVTYTPQNQPRRRIWASLAFWILLVVWGAVFGALGYALREPTGASAMLKVRPDELYGMLVSIAAIIGLLAISIGRFR